MSEHQGGESGQPTPSTILTELQSTGNRNEHEKLQTERFERLAEIHGHVFDPHYVTSITTYTHTEPSRRGSPFPKDEQYWQHSNPISTPMLRIRTRSLDSPTASALMVSVPLNRMPIGDYLQAAITEQPPQGFTDGNIEPTVPIRKDTVRLLTDAARIEYLRMKATAEQHTGEQGNDYRKKAGLMKNWLSMTLPLPEQTITQFVEGRAKMVKEVQEAYRKAFDVVEMAQPYKGTAHYQETIRPLESFVHGVDGQHEPGYGKTAFSTETPEAELARVVGMYLFYRDNIHNRYDQAPAQDGPVVSLDQAIQNASALIAEVKVGKEEGYKYNYSLQPPRDSGSVGHIYELFQADGTVLPPSRIQKGGRKDPDMKIYDVVAPTTSEMRLMVHIPAGSLSKNPQTDFTLEIENAAGSITPEQCDAILEYGFPKAKSEDYDQTGILLRDLRLQGREDVKEIITNAVEQFNAGDNVVLSLSVSKRRDDVVPEITIQVTPKRPVHAQPTYSASAREHSISSSTHSLSAQPPTHERVLPSGRDYVALFEDMRTKSIKELQTALKNTKGDSGMTETIIAALASHDISTLDEMSITSDQLNQAVDRLQRVVKGMSIFSGYTQEQRQAITDAATSIQKTGIVYQASNDALVKEYVGEDRGGLRRFQEILAESLRRRETIPDQTELPNLIEEALDKLTSQ